MKSVIAVLVLIALLVGCAPQVAPAPAPVAAPPSAATEKAVTQEVASAKPPAWEAEWEKMVAGAKREGVVVVYSSAGSEARTGLSPAFKQKYGISVEFITGKGVDVAEKFMAERRAGLYTGDVYVGGNTPMLETLKPSGALDPIEPVLILPEVKDPKAWFGEELYFVDKKDRTIFQFAAYPMPLIGLNTDMVKTGEIASYRDLLSPKWKGKLLMNDPTRPGVGGKWFSVEAHRTGLDFFRELAKQEPLIIVDQRLQVEWLARGKYPVLIAPKSDPFAEFLRAGSHILVIDPKEGGILTSGSGNVGLMNRAPHPNAARLFINWLLTREGQLAFSKASLVQSSRMDVPTDFLPPGKARDPQVKYFNAEVEEVLAKSVEDYKRAKEIFGHLMR